MGQPFDDPSQNNAVNTFHSSTSAFGDELLNFEDLLRTQDENGGGRNYNALGGGSSSRGEDRIGNRGVGSGVPSRQNSGESYRGSDTSGTHIHGSRSRPQRSSTTEETIIARIQEDARQKARFEQESQRILYQQQLARISAQNLQEQQGHLESFPDYAQNRSSSSQPSGSSDLNNLSFPQDDVASYLSEQEQQELLQYLNNSAGLSSEEQNTDLAQTVEAGSSFVPASVHSAPPLMMPRDYPRDRFSNYRTPHSASVSPQPSPAFRSTRIFDAPLAQDPLILDSSEYRHGHRLSVAGGSFAGGHHRTRSHGGQSVSSYAGSVHGGGFETLEGLEEQFAAGLAGTAEGYEGSDFGGMRAAGLGNLGQPPNGPMTPGDFQAAYGPAGLAGHMPVGQGRFQASARKWSEDDYGANDATAQWRATLQAQMPERSVGHQSVDRRTIFNEPLPYDPNTSIDYRHYAAPFEPSSQNQLSNASNQPMEPMSEFARRMNSESSDHTLESMASMTGELNGNGQASGNLVDEQFQREVMSMLRNQMEAGEQEAFSQGLGMPPLPSNGAVPPPRSQQQHELQSATQATSPQMFIEQMQTQVRSMAPPTFVSSPHFKSTGTFNQTKPHSPPALIIPDNSVPSPKSLPAQIPYPHQRMQDPGPSQLRQLHQPETMPPPRSIPPFGSGHLQSQVPTQNNMFLGIPSGGNFTTKDAYLSPIGPGGPSINIVPSTPISGLKDGKGIWEKLAVQAQAQQGGSGGASAGPLPGQSEPSSLIGGFDTQMQKSLRRASHSGNYIQRAPSHLDLTSDEQALQRLNCFPNTAPFAAGSPMLPKSALAAPYIRQRSRSEGQLQTVFSQFDIEAIRQLFGDQGSDDAVSLSGHSSTGQNSVTEVPPGVDPKMVMAASFGTIGNYQYDTSNLRGSGGSDAGHGESSQDAQGTTDAAAFAALVGGSTGEGGQNSYVITGVDPNGTTYILTRDGRRLSFDSRMARNLALMNPTSPDFQQTTFQGKLASEDVHMEHPEYQFESSNGSHRGRTVSRGHSRAVKSEDLRSNFEDDSYDRVK